MRNELFNLLASYRAGVVSLREVDEWLAGVDWNDPELDAETRNILGRLELLATDTLEQLREEEEFSQEVEAIICSPAGAVTDTQYEDVNQIPSDSVMSDGTANQTRVRTLLMAP